MKYLAIESLMSASPVDWPWLPLRRVMTLRRDRNTQSDATLLAVSSERGVEPRPDDGGRQLPAESTIADYWLVKPGDIVFNPMWAIGGGVAASSISGAVSPAYRVYIPGPRILPRFAHYYLRCPKVIEQYALVVRGLTTFDRSVTREDFEMMPVPVPSLAVQHAIAEYLDNETARIDSLIAKKRRMIDLLEERINVQVSDYIRRSPLAGKGEVEVVPIRRVLTKLERWADGGNMVTAFRDGEVTTREARNREGFTNAWTETARVQQVEVGDVVIHGLDGFSGAIGDARASGVCSPVYHVCTPKQGDGTFYGRMLRLLAIEGYLGNFAISTRERAVDFRNWDLFGRIPVPLVPTDEQRAIGDEIRKIRPLRDRIVTSEALALEHRQALIAAAVTGELEIPIAEAVV